MFSSFVLFYIPRCTDVDLAVLLEFPSNLGFPSSFSYSYHFILIYLFFDSNIYIMVLISVRNLNIPKA